MFKRKKVHPSIDKYIERRYDDIAVCIYTDLRSGRGLQNYYAPWLERMLQGFPKPQREKYSLMTPSPPRPALSAWPEEPPGPSTGTVDFTEGKPNEGLQAVGGGRSRALVRAEGHPEGEALQARGVREGLDQPIPGRLEEINTQSHFCIIL